MHTTTSADGTTLAYDRVGDGPSVICVGGALNDRRTTAPVAAGLADRFTAYSYDRRGRGDSGDADRYAVRREIEDLAAMIEVAGGSARVFGMSSGAVLAWRAAAAGLPVERLALYEPPLTSAVDGAPPTPPDYERRLAAHLAAGRRAEALALFMGEVVGIPADLVAGASQVPALRAIAHTLRYDAEVTAEVPPPVDVPTLVLVGGESPRWMHEAAATVGGEVRVLAGQTHDVDPAVLAEALAAFFR